MYTGAGVEVDDLHAAPKLGVRFGKLAVEGQPLEALVAWFGQADKGIFAIEGSPRTKLGQKASSWNLASSVEAPSSIQPISPVPEFSTQSLPR